jgi:uncharacterized damage-inducible protein DinB
MSEPCNPAGRTKVGRRNFLGTAAAASAGIGALASLPQNALAIDDRINVIGPRTGYSPQIGTLVSMLTWMRRAVLVPVRGLDQASLDHLFDKNANTIGALLLHLAATETYYQLNTFEGLKWDSWSAEIKKRWDPAMGLDQPGRDTIKGHDLNYYLKILEDTRAKTLAELKKRDDAWLLSVDDGWPWGPTDIYCKWFHVCEHESHHSGQIAFLTSRLPNARH